MPTITPFLWFEHNASEALAFYSLVFKDANIGKIHEFSEVMPGPDEGVMQGTMTLLGQTFYVLQGGETGADSKFNNAVSFFITCDTQAEIDYFWEALTSDGGEPIQCGWLKDKYGLRWQVVPRIFNELITDTDAAKAEATQKAMLSMVKLNIAQLQAAHDNA